MTSYRHIPTLRFTLIRPTAQFKNNFFQIQSLNTICAVKMNHFQTFLLHFLISTHPVVHSAIDCVMNSDNWCIFDGINLNETHPFFEPSYHDPSQVQKIFFNNSKIPILTWELCETFPNLRELDPTKCSLKRIMNGALKSCAKLERLKISNNAVTEINSYLFVSNPKMTHIRFASNKLTDIDVEMFNSTTNLELLELHNNSLVRFDVLGIPMLQNLHTLSLNLNNLLDLNETVLVFKFPNLKKLWLEGNLFECRNLELMLKVINENNNIIQRPSSNSRTRPSTYNITNIDGIECLDRESYSKAIVDEIRMTQPVDCSVEQDIIKEVSAKDDNPNVLITVIQLISSGLIFFCMVILAWQGWFWQWNFEEKVVYNDISGYYETTNF